jgi:hypothetical protein
MNPPFWLYIGEDQEKLALSWILSWTGRKESKIASIFKVEDVSYFEDKWSFVVGDQEHLIFDGRIAAERAAEAFLGIPVECPERESNNV